LQIFAEDGPDLLIHGSSEAEVERRANVEAGE
jgi:hypothetical protein